MKKETGGGRREYSGRIRKGDGGGGRDGKEEEIKKIRGRVM